MNAKNARTLAPYTQLAMAFLASAVLFTTGCTQLSEEEVKSRQGDAFDLSGAYTTKAAGESQVEMSFTVVNVSGRHSINITARRETELTTSEVQTIQDMGIDPRVIRDAYIGQDIAFKSLADWRWDGGDNISDNKGASTRFNLCKIPLLGNVPTNVAGETATVEVCISGVAQKASLITIQGSLQLRITASKPKPADEAKNGDTHTYRYGNAVVAFSTSGGKTLAYQYMGRWNGEVYLMGDMSPYLSSVIGVEITKIGSAYSAHPLYREFQMKGPTVVRKDTIEYEGKTYSFEKLESSLQKLNDNTFPVIRMVYRQNGGTERVVFVGTIWSLSNFAGNILLIDASTEREVGSFKFTR